MGSFFAGRSLPTSLGITAIDPRLVSGTEEERRSEESVQVTQDMFDINLERFGKPAELVASCSCKSRMDEGEGEEDCSVAI